MQRRHQRPILAALVLSAALLLAACGGGSDSGGVTLQSVESDAPTAVEAPSPATTQTNPDYLSDLNGRLAFVKGQRMYVYPHPTADEPVAVSEPVDPDRVWLTPDRDTLLYSLAGSPSWSRRDVFRLDLRTLDSTPLSNVWSGFWLVRDWSPDREWAVVEVRSYGLILARLDGTEVIDIAQSRDAQTHWLPDGRLLVLDDSVYRAGSAPVFTRVALVNLTTVTLDSFTIDAEAQFADPDLLVRRLAAHGITLPEPAPPPQRLVALQGAGRGACRDWQIVRAEMVPAGARTFDAYEFEPTEILHVEHEVYRVDHVTRLADGSLLYLRWMVPDCRLSNPPVTELVRLIPGDGTAPSQTTVIADNVFPGLTLGLSTNGWDQPPPMYAVAPDERHVAWVSGDLETGTTALTVTDLATGAHTVLFTDQMGAGSLSDFVDERLYNAVYWAS